MRPPKLSAIRVLSLVAATFVAPAAVAQEDVMVVFDGSNSMWGQIDGVNKIVIARDVMGNLLGDWTENRNIGLMAYGHRRRGDCTDIEVLVQPGAETRQTILDRIGEVVPTGKTPLTTAVEQAARELSYTDRPATVVLISDGLESCERDPCALADELERSGVGFTAHVVGFGLGAEEDTASLACIADRTGGTYVTAGNAQELAEALNKVAMAVAEPTQKPTPEPLPEQEPEPAPEPEPEPEPELPAVTVTGPPTAVGGADITVTWEPTLAEGDYITVVPVGTKEGEFGPYDRVGKAEAVTLLVPGEAGAYEIRYVNRADRATLGSASLEVTAPDVTLTAADTVSTGAMLEVGWSPTINARDTVTIVPQGAETGATGNYAVTRSDTSAMVQAPATPGLYEIRYLLAVDKRTVASRPLEVTEAAVSLDVPETALTGGFFDVGWSGAVNPRDYITIVATGADEGTFGTYITVRDDTTGQLRAPADTGLYEVRYVLREGNKTLASAPIEVTAPEVTVSGPATALTGARVDVSWTGAVARDDYITIVPVGTDEGVFGDYITVRDHETGQLTMPAETGLYELRYVLREGSRTLATAPLEVIAADVTVTGPETALAGSKIDVGWSGAVARDDYITIVPVGTDEGEIGNYITVRNNESAPLTMPAETGLYELRYVLRQGSRTLATAPIEIVAPEVSVTGPETTLAGSVFEVSWTGTVNTNDYVTIVPVGTDAGVYGNYFSVRSATSHDLQAPAEPGMYEIRYVLREDGSTLATAMIELTEPEVTISAPEAVRAGDTLPVSWTGTVSRQDYVTLVPTGTPDDTYGDYFQVRQATERDMQAPEETGLYEVRYMLREGGRVLARQTVEILAADATLETGATVTAPDSAAPGTVIEVGWTSGSSGADQRISLARADQAIFTWISAVRIADEPRIEITLPDAPGAYEIRLLDVSNREVLARKVITVE